LRILGKQGRGRDISILPWPGGGTARAEAVSKGINIRVFVCLAALAACAAAQTGNYFADKENVKRSRYWFLV
jgi:hypothetical protein